MIEERIKKKLSSWKGKYLSVGGRIVLMLSSMPELRNSLISQEAH
jgi:hypothetical protein